MSDISAQSVKELRNMTGAGMMECKKALQEVSGDVQKAAALLKKKGAQTLTKRAGQTVAEGAIFSYIHPGARIGVLVELGCETDFAARNEVFQELGKDLCMHVAATAPRWLTRDEVPEEEVQKIMAQLKLEAETAGKSAAEAQAAAEAASGKQLSSMILAEQPYVKSERITVTERLEDAVSRIREKIVVKRFCRFKLGEV